MATDTELITQAVLDYFEGWYDGDVTRMDRALHPDLVKRSPERLDGTVTTKEQMLQYTAERKGTTVTSDRQVSVTIFDVCENIATVRVRSSPYYEHLHLVRTDHGWKILNSVWLWR